MAIREIITAPDPRLKEVSKPVERVDADLRALMDDMLETMYAAPGIGLAAIQIGVPKQVIVMDLAREGEEPQPRYFINPEILWTSEDVAVYEEGCLSVPEFYEDVERPARCRVRYLDYQGEIREEECDDLLATCLQHEMDHLKGILFIDHLSRTKRSMLLKKLMKQKKLQKEPA
ncbi:peptide deformylase [Parvibaculum lavamentivorans DS-1]|uniref:Peptide deformylase n=1 Tax=Parvibaculum lavamentivorans (strain DS-1 / DSM 13023 / NCIMB 13966) TaxID=402881 RepID=A7HPQ1_PARL1|nr:peptide deformylase [Parvibaculum lavamentivorans]ABS61884.1 peptide deformylase [Parvibaculum lavamentivorans DS-1]